MQPEAMNELDQSTNTTEDLDEASQRWKSLVRFAGYIIRRALLIFLTIVVGVYITVLIANKGGQLDDRVEAGVDKVIRVMRTRGWLSDVSGDEQATMIAEKRVELMREAGYYLPTGLRNLYWTWKALRFDWGVTLMTGKGVVKWQETDIVDIREILLEHLPNTLLLIGTADFFIFILGIPLALYIASRKQNHWMNRLFTTLSPLSSIPSWVYGILLVAIFAAGMRVLPFGGKYDILPPETTLQRVETVARHMILPVTAILLGIFFQLVFVWRTYFTIYSEEDYVDLAIAKGLKRKMVERQYILKPTMPYILTSFALTLVGFWQMTTALEYFFSWPGIGLLYVNALPNYLGLSFYPGEMSIVISIVVLFAYLLGMIVFVLDLAYAWLDPRIRLNTNDQPMQVAKKKSLFRIESSARDKSIQVSFALNLADSILDPRTWLQRWKHWIMDFRQKISRSSRLERKHRFDAESPMNSDDNPNANRWQNIKVRQVSRYKALPQFLAPIRESLSPIWREIRKSPAAIFGFIVIILMLGGSFYAFIAYPYAKVGRQYYTNAVTGKVTTPKNAPPAWINWFRKDKLPATQVLNSQDGTIEKTVQVNEDGTRNITFNAVIDYPYNTFPQDILIYFDANYQEKRPFISARWITPDGRDFNLKNTSIESASPLNLSDIVNVRIGLRKNPNVEKWFIVDGAGMMPPFHVLFADPESGEPAALPGEYSLELSALTFEEDSDVEIELYLLGQVSGIAGTDSLRRDLIVPLLWGMPFALAIGIIGAVVTTFAALILSAAGTWRGGWLDNLIQRLTEVNMILPVLAIGILVFALYDVNLYYILGAIILLSIFGSPTKTFRSAFLQVKEEPFLESARAYGASNTRIVFRYMIPRIFPLVIPQLIILIPSFVFLEATLAIFNVFDPRYPTWGKIIYEAISRGAWWGGSHYWVLEPISLLLLAGLGFALLGSVLERILTPRLQDR